MLAHRVVPEPFHFPGKQAHIRRTADRNAIAPQHIGRDRFIDAAQPHFGFRNFWAPSATSRAIAAVLPLAESKRTRILFMAIH